MSFAVLYVCRLKVRVTSMPNSKKKKGGEEIINHITAICQLKKHVSKCPGDGKVNTCMFKKKKNYGSSSCNSNFTNEIKYIHVELSTTKSPCVADKNNVYRLKVKVMPMSKVCFYVQAKTFSLTSKPFPKQALVFMCLQ